ncbi:GNAT family N-acetyltransferase [Caulobacter sp. 17J65-9]|uniref:GNAT family N-acetyltransferase n=1 Tax=Caulobacter sp. 17J65-9 TaxID=2709382 RepID=UPI003204EEF0
MSETAFRHLPEQKRFEWPMDGGEVWARYSRDGDTLAVLHVEADPALRGTGAAGRFMQALVEWARAEGVKLRPVCSYAAVWLQRSKASHDVLA